MATIVKRKSKGQTTYLVRVRRKGHPNASATFHRMADARAWGQKVEADMIAGRYPATSANTDCTIAHLVDRYIAEVMPHKRWSTARNQIRQFQYWKSHLGPLALTNITPALLAKHRDHLASTGKSPSTVNRYMAALSHAFTIAVKDWGWVPENPMAKIRKFPEPQGRVRWLSDDERTRLLATCRESQNPFLYILVVLSLSTGARQGELLGLKWGQVDIERGSIYLEQTKNGTRRTLHLAGHAHELMKQHAQCQRADTQLVFPGRDGTRPIYIKTAWQNAVKRAGIRDFRWHDQRHCAASALLQNGATLVDVKEILGHKDISMTMRYAHLSQDREKAAIAAMNAAIFGQLHSSDHQGAAQV